MAIAYSPGMSHWAGHLKAPHVLGGSLGRMVLASHIDNKSYIGTRQESAFLCSGKVSKVPQSFRGATLYKWAGNPNLSEFGCVMGRVRWEIIWGSSPAFHFGVLPVPLYSVGPAYLCGVGPANLCGAGQAYL